MIKEFLILCSFITSVIVAQPSLNCNNNIFCDPATLPQDVYTNNTRSVIRIRNSDGQVSTATLIKQAFNNGDDNQQKNIIITSRHCIHKGDAGLGPLTDLSQMEFYFNYSNPGCATIPNVANKVGRYKLTGATLIDEGLATDMAVLMLNDPIPPHFKPFYFGWTANPIVLSGAYFDIHHPSGDIKKISSTNGILIGSLPIPTRYNITWTNGVTEGGSSGSGLFNFNRRLLGTLSTGFGNNCVGGIFAQFGKFRNFWLGNTATRNILNPDNIFGLIGSPGGEIECYSNDLFLNVDYWPAQDYQPTNAITIKCSGNMFLAQPNKPLTVKTGAEFNFEAGGQVITALPGFTAENGSEVLIKPNMSCTAMRLSNKTGKDGIDSNSVNYYYDEKRGELLNEQVYNTNPVSMLELFPNPSKGNFKLKSFVYTTDAYSYELIDVNGKILYSINTDYFDNCETETFQFTELITGVYMLKITNESTKKTEFKRVIIQK